MSITRGNYTVAATYAIPLTSTAIDTTGSSLLLVMVGISRSSTSITISDSKSNTWRSLTQYVSTSVLCQIFYAYDKAGASLSVGTGHTVTISFSPTSGYPILFFTCASGTVTDSSVLIGGNGAANDTLSTGTVTPSAAGDWVVSGIISDQYVIPTVASGPVSFATQPTTAYCIGRICDSVVANNNPIGSTFTGGTQHRPCCIACFKAYVAPAGGFPSLTLMGVGT
jgi:hypothetical protein